MIIVEKMTNKELILVGNGDLKQIGKESLIELKKEVAREYKEKKVALKALRELAVAIEDDENLVNAEDLLDEVDKEIDYLKDRREILKAIGAKAFRLINMM